MRVGIERRVMRRWRSRIDVTRVEFESDREGIIIEFINYIYINIFYINYNYNTMKKNH